jgi:predicted nuclease with RNAse H fold
MLFTDSVFVGIDPTSGRKSFTYAALDKDLNLLALAEGEMDDVTAFLAGQSVATVAVNAPSGVNRGLVRERMKKEMLTPHKIRRAEFRMAEYELRERGITVTGTAASVALCSSWVQLGFELYRKLKKIGFKNYSEKDAPYQILETHPHACFCIMAGEVPLAKPSLEGRLQRQLILYEHGVRIKDPMDFFEEITRHKMIKGIWPTELLYLPEQLDALAAAYTAWLAIQKADHIFMIGDAKEGQIVLPEKELKEKY